MKFKMKLIKQILILKNIQKNCIMNKEVLLIFYIKKKIYFIN